MDFKKIHIGKLVFLLDIEKCYDELSTRIAKTREARIRASERLERIDNRYQIIQLVYAISLTALSVWIFYLEKTGRSTPTSDASTILLICSFAITGTTFYVNSKNYKERFLQLKSNYIALGKLLYDIEAARCTSKGQDDNIIYKFQEHYEKYTGLLDTVENHTTFDYLNVRLSRKDPLSFMDKLKYILCFIEHRIMSWIISLSPLAIILWLILF